MNTRDLEGALRTMDAAAGADTPGQLDRKAALLEHIVSTPVTVQTLDRPGPLVQRGAGVSPRRTVRRLAAVVSAGATLAGALILIPGMTGPQMAYASWTARPSAVAGRDLIGSERACRDELTSYPARPGEDGSHFDAARIRLALADRRGDIVSMIFHQDRPEEVTAMCLVTMPAGSASATSVQTGVTGSSGRSWLPSRGRIAEGAMSGYGDRAWQLSGAAGDDVTGVTVHLRGLSVEATVEGNRYTAWGPGQAFGPQGSSGREGPAPLFTYDVRLADGTVERNVQLARPT